MDTATTDTDVQDRIEKAQSEPMEMYLVSEPEIVEVVNQSSDTTHSIFVDELYCSCADHRFRDAICKHMLFLMLEAQDAPDDTPLGRIGTAMRNQLTTRLNELEKKKAQLQSEMDDVKSEIDALSSARRGLEFDDENESESEDDDGSESETDSGADAESIEDLFDLD